jgi:mRNA interferase MazF
MACCCGRCPTPSPFVAGRLDVTDRLAPGWNEIWWTDLEQGGRRPALVLTRPEAIGRLPRILVAPASTTIRNLPTEVPLGVADGLPKDCVLMLDSPELVSRFALVEFITALPFSKWPEVCGALETAVNCQPR